jgi:exodeoxyribonuclease V alpha subunit
MFKEVGFKTLLLAPTAKAAERMKELDNETDAMTIHLALTMYATLENFEVVIIDEMSMVDFVLLNEFLNAIDLSSTKVIMVGDPNQLPPVGFGEPFIEIIESGMVPVSSLTKIYRQELQTINELAASALDGDVNAFMKTISNSKRGLSYVNINKDEYDKVSTDLYFTIGHKLGNLQKLLDNVLILSPVKNRTSACTNNINNMIALRLSSKRKKINFNDLEFISGDKVINRVNDYERRVMNGQIGYVGRKNKKGDVYIKFKEFMEFKEWELKHIQFAYSITIHSAQGQEADYIILPLHKQHLFMWTRRMLYTAITRAKKGIFFIGPSLRGGEGMKVIHTLLRSDFDKPKYMHLRKYIKGEDIYAL